MKKRLLSAALALAMVLTLLPLSAMPASAAGEEYWGKTVTYYAAGATYPGAASGATIATAGWYYIKPATTDAAATPVPVTTGVINSTGTSGTWYNDVTDAMGYNAASVKLLGNVAESGSSFAPNRSMTIDLNGYTWNTSGGINIYKQVLNSSGATVNNSLTKLTIQDTSTGTPGSFSGNIVVSPGADAGWGYNCEIEFNNVSTVGTVTMNHAGSGKVTVTNATVGAIDLVGVPAAKGGSTTGGTVTVTGSKSNITDHIKLNSFSGSTITGGKIDISGGAHNAWLAVVSTNNADIDVTNAKVKGVSVSGSNATVDIVSSQTDALTVNGLASADNVNQKSAVVKISGYTCAVAAVQKNTPDNDVLTGGVDLEISSGAKVTNVTLPNAAITVNGGEITTKLTLGMGSVKLGQKNASGRSSLGAVELGSANPGSVSLELFEMGNSSVGEVTEASGNDKTITVTIPGHPSNPSLDNNTIKKVEPTDINRWTKGTIAGGKFTSAPRNKLLNVNLLFSNRKDGEITFWYSNQINELVAYWESTTSETKIIGTGTQTPATVTFYKGLPDNNVNDPNANNYKAFEFTYPTDSSEISIQMPSKVGGQDIKEWNENSSSTPWAGGSSRKLPANPANDQVTFFADALGYTITKIENVAVDVRGGSNPTVTVKMDSGNVISLSGTVSGVVAGQNTANIALILETDAGDVPMTVSWVPSTKALSFSKDPSADTKGSMRLADSGKALELTVNGARYTLRDAGLTVEATGLEFDGNTSSKKADIVTTSTAFTGTNAKTDNEKLGKDMSGADKVDFSQSPAVLEAFGAAVAGINKSQVDSWRTQAQNQAYQAQYKKAPTTEADRIATGYSLVTAVLYMDVKVSQWSPSATPGSLTAVMTPYMRVEVRRSNDPNGMETDDYKKPIVVRNGQPLRAFTSDVKAVEVSLPMGSGYVVAGNVAHQNGTYVYSVDQVDAVAPSTINEAKFVISHAAANGNGFGTIVLNKVSAPVELLKPKAGGGFESYSPNKLYDTIQAAVDDALDGETVNVISPMGNNIPITMTGRARTIYIDTKGNATISNATSNNVVFSEKTAGHDYVIQLTRNTAVKPTEKPIPVTLASAIGGSASLSASRADEGDTITVTLAPAANYRVGGVTVTAAVKNSNTGITTNTTVTTAAASANSWRFVVPTGATSVTVTPSFVAITTTNATVTVTNPAIGGTAATSAGTNQVAPGTPVTVTVNPATGYRTMGIYVTNATATRTGANTFSFNVPAGTTNVVVTPRFDRNNNTLFDDVWSYDYFSSAVAWAVGRGITNGDGSVYHFGTGKSCTREDMVTFLWRNAGSPVVTGVTNPFWDVNPGSYYYNAVMWAVKNGVTNGVSANQFGVGRAVTRGEAVTFLYRAAGSPAASANSGFYDVPSGAYYSKAVSWAVGKGITNGDGSTVRFNPNGYCLREQIVTFMYRNATGTRA